MNNGMEAHDMAALEDMQAAQGTLSGARALLELATSSATGGREMLSGLFAKLDELEAELGNTIKAFGGDA